MSHLVTKDRARAGHAADVEPVLTVRAGSGERITFETDDAAYAQMEELRDLSKVTATLDPVTGPVRVEGAHPGDALAVTIHDVELAEQGWSVYVPGAGALAGPTGEDFYVRRVPVLDGTVHLADGITCPARPMIGCLGVAPARGRMSTVMPAYPTGGNMDLTDAGPGSTVYLPVEVEGALLSIGDLHAVMSRGESSFVAVEVAGRATVSVDVVTGMGLRAPRVDTGEEVVCVGPGDPVQDSVDMAYTSLFSVVVDEHGFSPQDAHTVMSALAHTELGGPTGSVDPDPLHPLRARGQVTLARIAKDVLTARDRAARREACYPSGVTSSPAATTPDVLTRARALGGDLAALRHDLHAHPEIGLELPRTQGVLLDALAGLGCETTTGSGCTSVTAVLRGGAPSLAGVADAMRPSVLLRADMDALPVREEVDVPFRSVVDGAMHACGHDLHMASLVGAARLLAERAGELPGDVVLMLQPGEEGCDGASVMIAEGVLEASGRRPEAAWATHVFSSTGPLGAVSSRPGPLMASSNALDVVVRGAGGHGSAPERAADPVPALCEMVLGLQARLTRSTSPFDPAVLTVGSISAGTARNIIPGTATLAGTVRCFDDAVLDRIEAEALRYCRGVGAAHGLEVDATFTRAYPVTVNDAGAVDVAEAAVADVLGARRFERLQHPISGSEDFSRVLDAVPGAMLFMAASPHEDQASRADNHSPTAAFDDAVLPDVAALLTELATRTLASAR